MTDTVMSEQPTAELGTADQNTTSGTSEQPVQQTIQENTGADQNEVAASGETTEQAPTSAPIPPPAPEGPPVSFKIIFGKNTTDVTRPSTDTVGTIKELIFAQTKIPTNIQKLLLKGKPLKDDAATLAQSGVTNGAKLMLIGSVPSDVSGPQGADASSKGEWDAKPSEEPVSKQSQHAKVVAKGRPEEAMPGIKDKQVPLAEEVVHINGLLNSQGTKVRLTFKPELQQLWIGSATATQKVPYSSITKIESWPIEGQEEYSILALNLGSGAGSKYWLYYFPSQHVAAVKIRILGLQSLI